MKDQQEMLNRKKSWYSFIYLSLLCLHLTNCCIILIRVSFFILFFLWPQAFISRFENSTKQILFKRNTSSFDILFEPMLSSSQAIYRCPMKISGVQCLVNDDSKILSTYREIEYVAMYGMLKMYGNNKQQFVSITLRSIRKKHLKVNNRLWLENHLSWVRVLQISGWYCSMHIAAFDQLNEFAFGKF